MERWGKSGTEDVIGKAARPWFFSFLDAQPRRPSTNLLSSPLPLSLVSYRFLTSSPQEPIPRSLHVQTVTLNIAETLDKAIRR
jgi:hypothetical protein